MTFFSLELFYVELRASGYLLTEPFAFLTVEKFSPMLSRYFMSPLFWKCLEVAGCYCLTLGPLIMLGC